MAIYNQERGELMTREVAFTLDEDVQVCRVRDSEPANAYEDQLMFAQTRGDIEDGSWVGKSTDDITSEMAGEPVVLRFRHSGAVIKVINDLLVIYGNLRADGK